MKPKAVLLIYGTGGHKEQMKRVAMKLKSLEGCDVQYIGICEENAELDLLDRNYLVKPIRDKFSRKRTLIDGFSSVVKTIYLVLKLLNMYDIKLLVSTGPGIVLLPSVIFKLLGKKIIFIETWSRFYTQSFTGKLMYRLAGTFYIQNKSLAKFYPKSKFGGLL